ncbi:MAG: 50S ribosomal protein L13 [Candidatus Daviesbacteria bacterium]|nr:MAG: 50S ribosomal protein L13 [Candidatus Daviesbacteria bacterium]
MPTNQLSAKEIKRNWHLVDAKDQVLGKLAVDIARKLTGKGKVNFVPYLDSGDYVVVTNASKVVVTGKKTKQKNYFRHSGYPGGLKVENFEHLINRRPGEVIRHAVWGMVPKNKLGRKMITRLKVFAGENHPFANQISK